MERCLRDTCVGMGTTIGMEKDRALDDIPNSLNSLNSLNDARSCSRVDGTRPMYYTTTHHMRRSKEAGRRRWLWHVHGRGMRMPRLHGHQEEGSLVQKRLRPH